ncbi:hypothetical protein OCU04_003863 [Sclerotinia nivalis]|uniref:Uncharacterized protein n=1 Tax=Sclerotinia nivalis TaxID=352851 RepID=A0A9X0ASS9_9HELO|nr:hypothetical protein OCU04_003863 [Sclerotinia nivalis]
MRQSLLLPQFETHPGSNPRELFLQPERIDTRAHVPVGRGSFSQYWTHGLSMRNSLRGSLPWTKACRLSSQCNTTSEFSLTWKLGKYISRSLAESFWSNL